MTEIMLGVTIVLGCTVIEGLAQVFLKLSTMRATVTNGNSVSARPHKSP